MLNSIVFVAVGQTGRVYESIGRQSDWMPSACLAAMNSTLVCSSLVMSCGCFSKCRERINTDNQQAPAMNH
jgi:hypothetical protein